MDTTTKLVLEWTSALADALPKLFEIFRELGGRDAFLKAVDGALATARAKTDDDLRRKHGLP